MDLSALRNDVDGAVELIGNNPAWEMFCCHELARIYAAYLHTKGYPTSVRTGEVSYKRGFLADRLSSERHYSVREEQNSELNDKLKKILKYAKELNEKWWGDIAGDNPEEFTNPVVHSWCDLGDIVLDHHPGGMEISPGLLIAPFPIFLIKRALIGQSVIYDPCGEEIKRNGEVYVKVRNHKVQINPFALELANQVRR